MPKKISVLIIDDSAVVRQVTASIMQSAPDILVLPPAADPLVAIERMKQQWPDVIILDVEMPRMDGITFLRKIMAERPTPVVMCSSLTEKGTQTTMDALEAGAVAILTKPKLGIKGFLENSADELINAVREAAASNVRRLKSNAALIAQPARPAAAAPSSQAMARTTESVVAIGTSTGGTQALEILLRTMPRVAPGMVIVQHMPERFTAAFAKRLDELCEIEVIEGKNGDRVIPGRAIIAPGGRHMALTRSGAQYRVEILDGPPVSRHRPSVDVLFRSVAKYAGRNALGVIMTGMGDDGAHGMVDMHNEGAFTIAQDEETCVVYGMPKVAVRLGAVDLSLPLQRIGAEILART